MLIILQEEWKYNVLTEAAHDSQYVTVVLPCSEDDSIQAACLYTRGLQSLHFIYLFVEYQIIHQSSVHLSI